MSEERCCASCKWAVESSSEPGKLICFGSLPDSLIDLKRRRMSPTEGDGCYAFVRKEDDHD